MLNAKQSYFTKSRFNLACECPTKLFYTNKTQYPNSSNDDPFLSALADGGFQIGELAKQYFPTGNEIAALNTQEAISETEVLLQHENVVIFEPAIKHNNLLIRIDILVKSGNHLELIEVKAKSYSAREDKDFLNAKGGISSNWRPYIFDVAFQKYVLQSAFPKANIHSYLMLVDKAARCPSNGLNQKFKIVKNDRTCVELTTPLSQIELNTKLLKKVNVDNAIKIAYANELQSGMPGNNFKDNIHLLATHYENDIKIAPVIGKKCKQCEFYCSTNDEERHGKLNGKKICWQEQLNWHIDDFDAPSVLDVWNFRNTDKFIQDDLIKLTDITLDDFDPEGDIQLNKRAALTTKERQWLQIKAAQTKSSAIHFDDVSMAKEFMSWTYPLHFIDFETSAVAIPFYKGMRPYEGIAFQFSHHQVNKGGEIIHAGQYLNTDVVVFPNFEFIRALWQQLSQDEGTIFMYSSHENTFLNTIYNQLLASQEEDKDILCQFIQTITFSTPKNKPAWRGKRQMVDMLKLVKDFYFDPATNGSNSIKYVLPAMLNSSDFLKEKYSQPIYGTKQLPSCNFEEKKWITFDENGKVIDPYKLLPDMFSDIDDNEVVLLMDGEKINNGGLALTAYAKMQFSEMSDYERIKLRNALLQYCELDTWAMVAIFEGWREMLKQYQVL